MAAEGKATRRISLIRWCGQDWTTPAELCSGPSTGLLHLPFSLPSRRLESHGWTISLFVFSCAGVCIYHFPFPCAPAECAACAMAGVLGRRGFPLECAAAEVCREVGARVSTNVHVRDLDLTDVNVVDGWRLEVVADGFSLWHGAQLAIDTTLVSLLHSNGSARRRAADHDSERTCPELVGGGRARWSCWLLKWAADGAKKMPLSSLPWPRRVHFAGQGPSCVDSLVECNACVFRSSGFRSVFARPPSSAWHRGSHPISARGLAGCMCL